MGKCSSSSSRADRYLVLLQLFVSLLLAVSEGLKEPATMKSVGDQLITAPNDATAVHFRMLTIYWGEHAGVAA